MKRFLLGLIIGLLIGTATTAVAANTDIIQAKFSKFRLQIDGADPVEIDPLVHEGTTYLPVRKAGELLGYDVDYINETRTITFDSKEQKPSKTKSDDKDVNEVGQTILDDKVVSIGELVEFTGAQLRITGIEYANEFGNNGLYPENHFAILTVEYSFEPSDKIDLREVTMYFDPNKNPTVATFEFLGEWREVLTWLDDKVFPNSKNIIRVGFQISKDDTINEIYLRNPLNKKETATVVITDQ